MVTENIIHRWISQAAQKPATLQDQLAIAETNDSGQHQWSAESDWLPLATIC